MQVEELAPGVGQATDLDDALGHQCLVAGEVIADQTSLPTLQERTRMRPGTALTEVVDHCSGVFERTWCVGP